MDRAAFAAAMLYLLSAAVLGLRMLHLFWTRGAPSGLLGTALLLGAMPVHASALLIVGSGAPASEGAWQLAYAVLLVGAGVAGASVMRFTTEVFHPRSRWLPRGNALIAGLFAVAATTAPFQAVRPLASPLVLLCMGILAAILAWTATLSFAHLAMYRRGEGLDPLVVDRFRLWGIAAVANVGVVPLVALAGDRVLWVGAAALLGGVSSLALWLAFLPPKAYVRRVRAREAPAVSPAP
jgi:hypothetical protein